jgi:hypothetical protein
MKMVQRPEIIERTENGERFENASQAGTRNITTSQVRRLGSTPSRNMNRVLPSSLLWSQYPRSNLLIFASL